MPHVRQHGVEQLLRKGLDRLAALGALAHRHEHVLGDGGEEVAEALDDLGVRVARAPQRDRPHLVDVRPQQRAALDEHVAHEADVTKNC